MIFMQLPVELLDKIIQHTLPEGFESAALTCKKIYGQCMSFIAHHNELSRRFRTFYYYMRPYGLTLNLTCASDLLLRISTEPVVARYIRSATFAFDSRFLLRQLPKSVPSIDDGGFIVDLFANSVYLKEADLDWKEYYTTFESDVRERRYSQHGAAFLLTLLPNIEKLVIPRYWKPNNATDKLLDAVIDKARESSKSSLASVTRLEGSTSIHRAKRFDLRWVSPLLALPHVRSFRGPSCLKLEDMPKSLVFRDSHLIAGTLQTAHLVFCCIDDVGIADFLRHAPSLKTLRYKHCTKIGSPIQDWDICKFVNAVEREAGSCLVQLSVTISELQGSIVPGKASTRGFQRLQRLEIPLELVMCNIAAAAGHTANPSDPVLDLIPTSVTQLSLKSRGTDHHEQALDALFRHWQSNDVSQLSALQEMQISCLASADDVYKDQCDRVVRKARDKGVVVVVHPFLNNQTFRWDGES